MKNYYDELEISKTASKEVIEKVYKVLAKKYHPDTTKEVDKQAAEEKFKIISEAYEILSDDEKRKKYDLELEELNPTISYEDYMDVINQRDSLSNTLNNLKNEFYQFKNSYNANNQYYNPNAQTQYNQNQYTQNQFNQSTYNQTNFNNGYNNIQNMNQNINPNFTNQNSNPKKKIYYNTVTGKQVSSFTYFKYKTRELFSNIILFALFILAILLFISNILSINLFNLLFI